ncbi:hypothetical protein [Caballeronia fortuita]|uniref:hypothetical protein n=1 Tax=Caballeronia fortuita TaxID=1777138 RepID=UPI0012FD86B0|nr:hypothetical protein [Caballeronia fortuita]
MAQASATAQLTGSALLPWAGIAVMLIALLAIFYLRANLHAPMQRDGAHFVFMANNIANGQPPYWASFETKNPLVEMYWSPFLHFLGKRFGLVEAARIGEAVWLAATALLLFFAVARAAGTRIGRAASAMPVALAAALGYLVLASDVRATDDGLNIALYQSLPELALVLHLVRRPAKRWFVHGLIAGLFVFLGWFVKQSSLLPDALVVAAWLLTALERKTVGALIRWLVGMGAGALAGAGAFWLHLEMTGTTYNYLLGAVIYRTGLSPGLITEFFSNAKHSFAVPFWTLPLGPFLAANRVWTTIVMIVLIPLAVIDLWRSRSQKWSAARVSLLLCVCWMAGAWSQAVLGLTFFPHYFLASLAPVCAVAGIVIARRRPTVRTIAAAVAVLAIVFLVRDYRDMREANIAAGQQAPINRTSTEVLRYVRPGDKVFNYSGLPNVLVAFGEPSAYPLNMNWPYIMTALTEDARWNLLKKTLADAPDVVIAMNERYPGNQGLANVPMTAARLKALTGRDYVLVHTTAPIAGRYGDPVSVFRRQ